MITGGAGFVGSHIADALLEEGASEVIALDNLVRGSRGNFASALRSRRATLVEGDVRDSALVDRLCDGCDYIFHEAALRITACAANPREAREVMFDGTFNVLESAVKHKVKKVVSASSASVYGEPSHLPINEDHPFNNRTLYGAAKVAGEQLLRSYNDMFGLPYVALRYFNLYGPRMDMTGVYTEVMIRWLDTLDAGKLPVIFGTGTQTMDFVYILDCVRANVLALKSDVSDEAFNVATGVETSLNELCQKLCEAAGHPETRPEYAEPRKVNPVERRRGGTAKAEEMLGFEARVEVADGLRQLIEWRKAQRMSLSGERELVCL